MSQSHLKSPIAILSALPEEQQGLVHAMSTARTVMRAGREFSVGVLHGQPVVLALSRIGKVAAATTTATLLEHFGVRAVLFTGVAGGVGDGVQVGDVVLATQFVQYDMDAAPLFPRFEVPLTGRMLWPTHAGWSDRLFGAAQSSLVDSQHDGRSVRVHRGLIATGDRFLCSTQQVHQLRADLAEAGLAPLAVEMEGAAVAQVCSDYGVPFAAVRTISDRADDSAHVDFPQFVATVASVYAQRMVSAVLQSL